jgi:hypothetical protein
MRLTNHPLFDSQPLRLKYRSTNDSFLYISFAWLRTTTAAYELNAWSGGVSSNVKVKRVMGKDIWYKLSMNVNIM